MGCDAGMYLHWTEDDKDVVGTQGLHSNLRRTKTPFRKHDYLLKNFLKYIQLPSNIHFVSQSKLNNIIKESMTNYDKQCKNSTLNNIDIIFREYTGLKYTLQSFMTKYGITGTENRIRFETLYYNNFKSIKFINIPTHIVDYFKNTDNVLTVHLRRGDKVANDNGASNGIVENELGKLNDLTVGAIEYFHNNAPTNQKNICFVSDEKLTRNKYINMFGDKMNCISFDGDGISQTYIDIYCLVHSKKIILSQSFSVFSIFSSLVNRTELYYLLEHKKMNEFSKAYDNINKLHF
jgi:hypothetical protein